MNQHKKLSRGYSVLAFGLGVLLCLLPACQQSKDKETSRTTQSDTDKESIADHTRTGTEEVHALLILLGSDRRIRETVNATEGKMMEVLREVSSHGKVNLTVMKSSKEAVGSTTTYTLQNGRTSNTRGGKPGDLIRSYQVVDWLNRLKPDEDDTVLIYYNGHGKMDKLGTHSLQFDPISSDTLDRERLGTLLNQKRARLRMLITDTCSETIDAEEVEFRALARTRERKPNYMEDLFLTHAGFLDITAASPGEVAIGNPDEGGHFTYALFTHGCSPDADKNNDTFITWKEAFDTAGAETSRLFKQASKELNEVLGRRSNRQKTQQPIAYSMPVRIGGGGGTVPPTPPDTTVSTSTSGLPAGAKARLGKEGHTDAVLSVVFSPDGNTIATGNLDGALHTLLLWDIATGRLLRTFTGHAGSACSVAFSPDGNTIPSPSWDHTVRLWDTASGHLLRTFTGHTDELNSTSFSPNGNTIASAGDDRTLRLWDVASGHLLRTFTGHTSTVHSVAFSPDGQTIVSASSDGTVLLWDAAPR